MSTRPTPSEVQATLPGDDLVPDAQVTMDRAVDLPAPPERVWPWVVQLGRNRAGWYLTRRIERLLPVRRRALREIDPRLQHLAVGDVVDDWGGPHAYFEIVAHDPHSTLVHRSERGALRMSWTIVARAAAGGTRLHFRFRIAGVKRVWLAHIVGDRVDQLTIAAVAAGLRERLLDR